MVARTTAIAGAEPAPTLATEGLGRRYRRWGPWALLDVTLRIPAGSATALVGPNGAGKTTLIRCWMGFERPDAGRALVLGRDPRTRRAEVIESVAYVSQSHALYGRLSIGDHLAMVQWHRPRFDRSEAVARLEALGLAVDRRVSELSGGERAKVLLAIALALHAPVLLLDEPMANLEPLARREFLTLLLEEVRRRGTTVVLSSHIVTELEEACDALIVLAQGRVLLHDSIESLRRGHVARPVDGSASPRLAEAEPVSVFSGRSGERLELVRTVAPPGGEATLEQIVLGYLASAVRNGSPSSRAR
ncbi:MAG TPA: ABC transporter ATP-binding protein [Candidatus Binatia bacterium]|nr:ABC transporter ATP-binding protein [Candidatus Binatia bacterium]